MTDANESPALTGSTARVEPRLAILVAVAMIALAELVYFFVWGLMLFPEGNLVGKVAWTVTCSVGMGAVIGALVIVFDPGQNRRRIWFAAAAMAAVGVYCTFLCSWIDARFGYFGGHDQRVLFIAAGVIPALLGGFIYAWALYAPSSVMVRRLFGEAP